MSDNRIDALEDRRTALQAELRAVEKELERLRDHARMLAKVNKSHDKARIDAAVDTIARALHTAMGSEEEGYESRVNLLIPLLTTIIVKARVELLSLVNEQVKDYARTNTQIYDGEDLCDAIEKALL